MSIIFNEICIYIYIWGGCKDDYLNLIDDSFLNHQIYNSNILINN